MRNPMTFLRDQHGMSLVELIVAAAVFALLFLAIDSVFIGAHRSTQQAELSADVDQNARIALERLTREIRETNPDMITCHPGGCPGGALGAVAFRSARPTNSDIFCLDVPGNTSRFYNAGCAYYGTFGGTYTPVWQRIVGYRLVAAAGPAACGPYDLHRYIIAQTALTTPAVPANPENPGGVTDDQVIASCIEDLQVSLADDGTTNRSRFTVTLKALGQRAAQGGIPAQEILLTGEAWIRND